jgi:hypothetical protein
MKHTGMIKEILTRATDYHITYANARGGDSTFLVGKTNALNGEFIAAAVGSPVELKTDHLNVVRMVKIYGTTVLVR